MKKNKINKYYNSIQTILQQYIYYTRYNLASISLKSLYYIKVLWGAKQKWMKKTYLLHVKLFRPVNMAGRAYQRVSLSPHHMFDCSILQRKATNGAALTVSDKETLPVLCRGKSQAWRLGQTRFMRIRIISVLLIPTARKAHTCSFFAVAVKGIS